MSPATLSLLILAVAIALFVWNRLPVGVIAVGTAVTLYLTGLVDAQTLVSGFGDPVVVFIASLFIVSEGLDAAGVTAWAGQQLTRRAGTGRVRLLTAVMLLAAALSALITPNGAAAALLPLTVGVARAAGILPSRMLIPLAYAASAGALLTLSGSPVNVIIDEASRAGGGPGFGYFEFALAGLPLVIGIIVVAVLFGDRLLPDRTSTLLPADYRDHAEVLTGHYGPLPGVHRLRVRRDSPLADTSTPESGALLATGLSVIGAQDVTTAVLGAGHLLQRGDVLVVSGTADAARRYGDAHGLKLSGSPTRARPHEAQLSRRSGVAEVVIPPRSRLVGSTVFPGMARPGGVTVLAVRRLGIDRGARPTVLVEGDALLLEGKWPAVEALEGDRDLLLVDAPELVRRQTAPLSKRAPQAIAILVGMVVLLATGLVPPAVGGLIAAAAMVAFRVLDPPQAYRAVSWQTVVLIGGLIPLSVAIQTSGAADLIAEALVGAVGDAGPRVLLLALFLLTAALGQVISNVATVLVVVPIATAAAAEAAISTQTVLMLVAVAGAAALLTPIATPANMIVMGPGGYRFGDYWKLGLPMMVVWLAVGIGLVPVFWPLTG